MLPTYQEADNVATVLRRIRSAVPQASVLVVDDSSPDGTAMQAERVAVELGQIEILRRGSKAGLGSAYRAGFRWGTDRGYDVLVEMDADGSHDPADVNRLLAKISEGADLAIGARYVPGGTIPKWSWRRRALSKWGNRFAARMLRLPASDATSGLRAYRAAIVADIDLETVHADGYGFQVEMVHRVARLGGRVVEVPICFVDRTSGTSKMSARIVIEALVMVTKWGLRDRLFSRRHYR